MQNSGRSQSPAAWRHNEPAGFSYADARLRQGIVTDLSRAHSGPGNERTEPAPSRDQPALTRQRAQQSPWAHWAPARSEQLWAKQQGSGHF